MEFDGSIAENTQLLLDTGAEGVKTLKTYPMPNHPHGGHWVSDPADEGGKAFVYVPPQKPRFYEGSTVDSILDLTKLFADDKAFETETAVGPVVWVGSSKIVVHCREHNRDAGQAFMDLKPSRVWSIIRGIADVGPKVLADAANSGSAITGNSVPQRDFIDLLRREFGREMIGPANLLEAVRTLKFATQGGGESVVLSGRESMGRAIQNEVTGASKLPDEMTLRLPVWDNVMLPPVGELAPANAGIPPALLEFTIALDLYVNPTNGNFTIKPLAGEVARIEREATARLAAYLKHRLAAAGVAKALVFVGRPG